MKFTSINLIYENFDVVCILAMRLHKAPKGSNSYCFLSNLTKVISLELV